MPSLTRKPLQPLKGTRVLSLSLNLPGPAALMRCRHMGATCVKLEPPASNGVSGARGDPMSSYCITAYQALHTGIRTLSANLKTEAGQKMLHRELLKTDVLLTSFRPSALVKLGLSWKTLHRQYPGLSQVAIVGAPGPRAEQPGHDLTYLAEHKLLTDLAMPPTLYADMGGALMASEAVLQVVMLQRQTGRGNFIEVALSDAAAHLALPRQWGITTSGTLLCGAHAGYKVYRCRDGRVAMAALEPHFAQSLCAVAGVSWVGANTLLKPESHQAIARFLMTQTRNALDALAAQHDIPLHTLPP